VEGRIALYPVYCSWCLERGVRKVTGYARAEHSHGICEEHQREMARELKALDGRRAEGGPNYVRRDIT